MRLRCDASRCAPLVRPSCLLLFALLVSELAFAAPRSGEAKASCGYQSCAQVDKNRLNVHIVAHTHDDVGWLKTVDQYFYGTRKRDSPAAVQHILDSVVGQLALDPSKRFIYVEVSFFAKWWREQEEQTRAAVRKLVQEGRLEFANGGWCMNDEATVTYASTVEQMTLGLKFLEREFGACARPKVGWQIDPFGHSNEQASLFAQFAFDGMFFTRISIEDKEARKLNKSLDLLWHADQALSAQSGSIFTSVLTEGYDAPSGFCFDALCRDNNLVDNPNSYEFNMTPKGLRFIEIIRDYARTRRTNQVLVPLGGDFQFSAAGQNFKNIDKLIKFVKSRPEASDINIFYSTPACYQKGVHDALKQSSETLPEKYDDFMPYDSSPTVWWSGFFASRPSVKLVERNTANLLQVARLASLAELLGAPLTAVKFNKELKEHEASCLEELWEVLGDLQHHDAVTGTEKQHVADDYVRRASDAAVKCTKLISSFERARLPLEQPLYTQSGASLCPLLNISQCEPLDPWTTSKSMRLALMAFGLPIDSPLPPRRVLMFAYNPLAQSLVRQDFRLPCAGRCDLNKIKVTRADTNESLQLERLPNAAGINTLPFRDATPLYEVLFYSHLPALGRAAFLVEDTNRDEHVGPPEPDLDSAFVARSRRDAPRKDRFEYFTMSNFAALPNNRSRFKRDDLTPPDDASSEPRLVLKFDKISGLIVAIRPAQESAWLEFKQSFGFYFPANSQAPPGAYIFRPNTSEPYLLEKPLSYQLFKRRGGKLIEVHQKWASWLWQTIRIDANKNYLEFDYLVGPVPVETQRSVGREVVTRYATNLATEGALLTDSGGRQLMLRKHRNNSDIPENLGASFYPVVSTVALRSVRRPPGGSSAEALAVLVDRAQAAASLGEGQLELLIHRRHMRDDNFGVNEALNEPGEDGRGLVVRGTHRLYLKFADPSEQSARISMLPPKQPSSPVAYLVQDNLFDQLRQEALRFALKPTLTFERLSPQARAPLEPIHEWSLLNESLPNNLHLLTLQPWSTPDQDSRKLLLRLENLDNPLTVQQSWPQLEASHSLAPLDECRILPSTTAHLEHLIAGMRIVALEELTLGANVPLAEAERLDWIQSPKCDLRQSLFATDVELAPRQIRTFIATFAYL